MNSAEFVCAREYLGLPIKWLAENLGVTVRSVHRWEAGINPVPDWAAQRMAAYLENTQRVVGDVTVAVLKDPAVSHLVYREDQGTEMPASWHRMVAARAAERTGRRIVWAGQAQQ